MDPCLQQPWFNPVNFDRMNTGNRGQDQLAGFSPRWIKALIRSFWTYSCGAEELYTTLTSSPLREEPLLYFIYLGQSGHLPSEFLPRLVEFPMFGSSPRPALDIKGCPRSAGFWK